MNGMQVETVRLTRNWQAEALRLRDVLAMVNRQRENAEERVAAMARREAELLRMVRQLQAKLDAAPLLVVCGDGRAA